MDKKKTFNFVKKKLLTKTCKCCKASNPARK